MVKAAIRVNMSCTARISGSDGVIEVPAFMHRPTSLTVTTTSDREEIDAAYEGDGLQFEIAEVHRCLAEGLLESPVVSLDETIALASTLDTIRSQVGVVYPTERP